MNRISLLMFIIIVGMLCFSFVYAQDNQVEETMSGYRLDSPLEVISGQETKASVEEDQEESSDEETPSEDLSFDYEEIDFDYSEMEHDTGDSEDVEASWEVDQAEE